MKKNPIVILLFILLLTKSLSSQEWKKDVPLLHQAVGACTWCDTSSTPEMIFTFGGNHETTVSVYSKVGSSWSWSDTPFQIPYMNIGSHSFNKWWEGKTTFLAKDHLGETVNEAVCVSGLVAGGLEVSSHTEVWTFDKQKGFSKPLVSGTHPGDRAWFGLATLDGRVYLYGGSDPKSNSDLFELTRTSSSKFEWRVLPVHPNSISSPPPSLIQCSLLEAGGILFLSGGARWELRTPINNRTWAALIIDRKVFWIELLPESSNIKWYGVCWYEPSVGAIARFGSTTQIDSQTFNNIQGMLLGNWSWEDVQLIPTPLHRWRCSGAYIPSEKRYLMFGGYQVNKGKLTILNDTWSFSLFK